MGSHRECKCMYFPTYIFGYEKQMTEVDLKFRDALYFTASQHETYAGLGLDDRWIHDWTGLSYDEIEVARQRFLKWNLIRINTIRYEDSPMTNRYQYTIIRPTSLDKKHMIRLPDLDYVERKFKIDKEVKND